MKNKSIVVMIEHIVMLLVFTLAATICIRMFVRSERLSRKYEATDHAVIVAQNAAEVLKNGGLQTFAKEENVLQTGENTQMVCYDKNWKVTDRETAEFLLTVELLPEENEFLFRGEVVISEVKGAELFRLPVAGQKAAEVTGYEEK